jgi:coproporphyrinogen III oxidase
MSTAGPPLNEQKVQAHAWFEALRDDLCKALEQLELDLPVVGAPLAGSRAPPGAGRITPAPPVGAEP